MDVKVTVGVINLLFVIFILLFQTTLISGQNKYSKEANLDYANIKDPLRMAKLNTLWEKARKRLSEPKLRKLLSELRVQDKEELTFKKLKSSGGDKEGLKEAELRKELKQIIKKYALENRSEADQNDDGDLDKKIEKAVFTDKKLHKLWLKAEQSGLTQEELKVLREEFHHHQDTIDEYYTLIEKTSDSPNDIPIITNDIHNLEDLEGSAKDYRENINMIREKHREIKNGYIELHKKATSGPTSKEFIEPNVAGLWKLALRSNFDNFELESLHTELKHYEARLHKLRYLSVELSKIGLDKLSDELSDEDREKIMSAQGTEGRRILEERLEKQKRKIEKLHDDLQARILARHSEL